MGLATLSREDRERILKTLEEDREFRYALMGLLGFKEILERQQRLEERFARLEERFIELEKKFIELENRFARIEEVLGVARVESWIYHDSEGIVYGHPAIVEVDVAIRDKEHILVEVKSRCSKADVAELYKIGKLYEKVKGVKPRLVILAGIVDRNAKELAEEMGVEIKTVERSDILLGL